MVLKEHRGALLASSQSLSHPDPACQLQRVLCVNRSIPVTCSVAASVTLEVWAATAPDEYRSWCCRSAQTGRMGSALFDGAALPVCSSQSVAQPARLSAMCCRCAGQMFPQLQSCLCWPCCHCLVRKRDTTHHDVSGLWNSAVLLRT